VEWAPKLFHTSAFGAQHRPAMQARIDIGFDLVRAGAHDNQGIMDDVIDDMIADIWDMLQPARKLPCLAPNLFHFPVMPVFGKIPLYRHICAALSGGRRFHAHDVWRGVGIAIQYLLHRWPWTARNYIVQLTLLNMSCAFLPTW
jgi:hypothetical protein